MAKNLGFSKIGALKATKEPSGTIMDSIFTSKQHKSHEMRRKVEASKAYPLKKYLDQVKQDKIKKFDETFTNGGTLLEVSTNAMHDAKMRQVVPQKKNLANALREQMQHRQKQLQTEQSYNQNFQAYQEADSAAYASEELSKVKNHRKKTHSVMQVVQ